MHDALDYIKRAKKAAALVEDPRILTEVTRLISRADEFLKKREYKTSMLFSQEAEKISSEDVKVVSTTYTIARVVKTDGNNIVRFLLLFLAVLIAVSRRIK